MQYTTYSDINNLLEDFLIRIKKIFDKNLIGIYLTGSLTYGDFNLGRSDIDLLVVVKNQVLKKELVLIRKLHEEIEYKYKKWAKRVECSYLPIGLLDHILPPKNPRPYIGGGIFYPEAPYGNEWIINNYLLYKYGITLFGPKFNTLTQPIKIKDVQKACIRDLYKEWQPKVADPSSLKDSHLQSYVVLNLCRILYTVMCGEVATKKSSALWVKNEFKEWKNLIENAENWKYGTEMNLQNETIEFTKFVIDKVNKKKKIVKREYKKF